MNKKGMSAIIATVLIILIVVVGVGIVWKVILPLFAELKYFSYSDVSLDIVFDGYTVYDPEAGFAFVQVERGQDTVNLTGIEIGFVFGGNTITYQTAEVPQPGGRYTYKFNFTNDSVEGVPDKVTVAPVFIINNRLELGQILDNKPIPSLAVRLSTDGWARAQNDSALTILRITNPDGSWNWGTDDDDDQGEDEDEIICVGENRSYDNGTLIEVCEFGCSGGVCDCGPGEVEYNGGCAIDVNAMQYYDGWGNGYNLTEPNRVYVLTEDIVLTDQFLPPYRAITIREDNIVLDGKGFGIYSTGLYSSGPGIILSSVENVSVINFRNITGYPMQAYATIGAGIDIISSNNVSIINVNCSGNFAGVISTSSSSSNILIKNSHMNANGMGLFMSSDTGLEIVDSSFCDNGKYPYWNGAYPTEDVYITSGVDCSGSGNRFDVANSDCGTWPEVTDYTAC